MPTWFHRVVAGLGAGLVAVGYHVPGLIGWVFLGVGTAVCTAVNGAAVFGVRKDDNEHEPPE